LKTQRKDKELCIKELNAKKLSSILDSLPIDIVYQGYGTYDIYPPSKSNLPKFIRHCFEKPLELDTNISMIKVYSPAQLEFFNASLKPHIQDYISILKIKFCDYTSEELKNTSNNHSP
jgi:hypothetical protein